MSEFFKNQIFMNIIMKHGATCMNASLIGPKPNVKNLQDICE